jgi:hypothetical protein
MEHRCKDMPSYNDVETYGDGWCFYHDDMRVERVERVEIFCCPYCGKKLKEVEIIDNQEGHGF